MQKGMENVLMPSLINKKYIKENDKMNVNIAQVEITV